MKKLNEKQIKRNLAFTVFMILFILSFFIFNPAWGKDHDEEKYCWISGKNFHDFKDAITKQCKTDDLIWVVSKGGKINAWNIEQTIGQYCSFHSEIVTGMRDDGSHYLQCILIDEKSRKRRVK
tara:strand:+ start:2004 stop:2372 length:369 start_codon:yes stop_codon:yes gene_type:complete